MKNTLRKLYYKVRTLLRNYKRLIFVILVILILFVFFSKSKNELFFNSKYYNIVFQLLPNLVGAIIIYLLLQEGISLFTGISIQDRSNMELVREIEATKFSDKPIRIFDTRIIKLIELIDPITKRNDYFENAIFNSIRRGIEIEIVLIQPKSGSLIQRAKDLNTNKSKSFFEDYMKEHLNGLNKLLALKRKIEYSDDVTLELKGNLKIYLCDTLPSITMHIFQNYGFFSFFPPNQFTDNSPDIKYSTKTRIGKVIDDLYLKILNDNHTYKLYDFMFLTLSENKSELKKHEIKNNIKFHFAFEEYLDFDSPKYLTYEFDGKVYDFLRSKYDNNEYINVRFEKRSCKIKIEKILDNNEYEHAINKIFSRYDELKNNINTIKNSPPVYLINELVIR